MNLTFGPMHIVGLEGQSRRNYRVIPGMGFSFWNLVETIGAFILATGDPDLPRSTPCGPTSAPRNAPLDPWDARTLRVDDDQPAEGAQLRRHPERALDRRVLPPQVRGGRGVGRLHQGRQAEEIIADQEAHRDAHIHMPSPSYWPLVIAVGLPIVAIGLIFSHVISVVGALVIADRRVRLGAGAVGGGGRRLRPAVRQHARSWRPLADVTADAALGSTTAHDNGHEEPR